MLTKKCFKRRKKLITVTHNGHLYFHIKPSFIIPYSVYTYDTNRFMKQVLFPAKIMVWNLGQSIISFMIFSKKRQFIST